MTLDLKGELTSFALFPADSKSSSVDGTGVDISAYIGQLMIVLDCEIGTTGDTLDVKLQDAAASSYGDISGATFTQVTDAALLHETIRVDTRGLKKNLRAVATIAGDGGEVFVFAVIAIGRKQVV